MLYYVSIIWIYCICSCCLHNVIAIFRSYYFIFRCYFNDSSCWIYYYWLSYMCNSFSTVWIYCVSRGSCFTSIFSWDSNIGLAFFSTSIFFVFYWGWDGFYFYFILQSVFFKRFSCCMLYDVSIGWIYCICSNFFDDVISVFRVYYFILSRDFNDCFCWIYYDWISFIWNNFPIIWIYCIGRGGCLTSIFSWDSNIGLAFFSTSIFFVFYWGWDYFYVYFILSWNFNNRISWFLRTNWLTFSCRNLTSIRIHSVSGCDSVFTIFTFNSSWGCTFFFRIIFFIDNR